MNAASDPIPPSLRQLAELSNEIHSHAQQLQNFRADLGDEHIGYVTDTNVAIFQKLTDMGNYCLSAVQSQGAVENPLADKDARHDMRNLIAVVKGFSELMKMDVEPNHPVAGTLDQLHELAGQFINVLDAIKSTEPVAA